MEEHCVSERDSGGKKEVRHEAPSSRDVSRSPTAGTGWGWLGGIGSPNRASTICKPLCIVRGTLRAEPKTGGFNVRWLHR